jgi:hypothetical protein
MLYVRRRFRVAVTLRVKDQDALLEAAPRTTKAACQSVSEPRALTACCEQSMQSRIELTSNVPVVIVDVQASRTFATQTSELNLPPRQAPLSGVGYVGSVPATVAALNQALMPGGGLSLRTETFKSLKRHPAGARPIIFLGVYRWISSATVPPTIGCRPSLVTGTLTAPPRMTVSLRRTFAPARKST